MPEPSVRVCIDPAGSRFVLARDRYRADLRFRRHGRRLILERTLVRPPLDGRGNGARLVRAAIEYAREHELAIVPRCTFAAAWLQRHPDAHKGVEILDADRSVQ